LPELTPTVELVKFQNRNEDEIRQIAREIYKTAEMPDEELITMMGTLDLAITFMSDEELLDKTEKLQSVMLLMKSLPLDQQKSIALSITDSFANYIPQEEDVVDEENGEESEQVTSEEPDAIEEEVPASAATEVEPVKIDSEKVSETVDVLV
jgi:hypothetical protein